MFGGDGNNSDFPTFLEENHFQYDPNALPQLQLFGNMSGGCNVSRMNYTSNENPGILNQSIEGGKESENLFRQQKFQISLNNNMYQDEGGQCRALLNPNTVSTGLRLSYEEDEHNSSVNTVARSLKATHPDMIVLENNLKYEIDKQNEELERYVRLQEENIMKGVRELKQKHTLAFLSAVERGLGQKLAEKDAQLQTINHRNKELAERIKQVAVEARSWHYRAKYNESVVNILQNNLKQVMAQGAAMQQVKEGCGDSEVDDAASSADPGGLPIRVNDPNRSMLCRACQARVARVLVLPCRHLSLCAECNGLADVCPVCRVAKNASVEVYMS